MAKDVLRRVIDEVTALRDAELDPVLRGCYSRACECLQEVEVRVHRKDGGVVYGIGDADDKGGYAMWAGPNPDLSAMLAMSGVSSRSVILGFIGSGAVEMYRWAGLHWEQVGGCATR